MLYAHTLPGAAEDQWQTLEEHLYAVAEQARQFANFGTPETAELLGKIHDIGKQSDSFQNRLRGKAGKVDHTSAAYLYLVQEWGKGALGQEGQSFAQLLAYPLLGHHGGMADFGSQAEEGSLKYRISGSRIRSVPEWKRAESLPLPPVDVFLKELTPYMCQQHQGRMQLDAFAVALLLRMLYSCLVDADFLDTERFCSPDKHALRPQWPTVDELVDKFFLYLRDKTFLPEETVHDVALRAGSRTRCGTPERQEAIRVARAFMLQTCIAAASHRAGIFLLTMPTGGGKTLSSMAFALRHAKEHGQRRIILVVPYTSIIEQNANVLRQALGENAVLEHHSNYSYPEENEENGEEISGLAYKLGTENWDATVIVTTSVQFFESLFDNRPSRCRKLHNIANSVIIFDEIQMLPIAYTKPCLATLKLLAQKYGSTIVLCSATQPALMQTPFLRDGFSPEDVCHIIPPSASPQLFRIFERVRVEQGGEMDDDKIADVMHAEHQVLCIVNSRKHARDLFVCLGDDAANFHLSARMTPEHRSRTLDAIRKRLSSGLACRVISTSLIECGVDISFPVVMREKNGLDVLAQSAGRCNREGNAAYGRVICFSSGSLPKRAAELQRRCQAFCEVASQEDLFCPKTVDMYFTKLYQASQAHLDEKGILDKTKTNPKDADGIWQFQFATIAREFAFIEDNTVNVIIEKGEAVKLLQQNKGDGALPPSTIRRLQRFSVQVYHRELECMMQQGRIEKHGFLYILSGGVGYNDKTGLDVTLENGVPVEDLLF